MTPILITGINGFLGKYLFKELNEHYLIHGLSRNSGEYLVDLINEIPKFDANFRIIIHAAGLAHKSIIHNQNVCQFHQVNVQGTNNLLLGLERSSLPKYFVFISSVSVYGIHQGNCVNEIASLGAKDPYGLSKIQAEHLVLDWCNRNNVICTILRLPLLVGGNPPGNLGAMIKGIKRGYYFNIAEGRAQKSMVLASDVAQCILKVSEIGGIYNLTDGYHPTFNELSHKISLELGRKFVPNLPLLFAKFLAKIGDLIGDKFPINSNKLSKIISPLTFDDSKARKAFGWNPSPVIGRFKIDDHD